MHKTVNVQYKCSFSFCLALFLKSLQAVKKKDKLISELRSELVDMEKKVSEANGRHRKTEEQLEELRQEMKDMESHLQTNQDEMMSLHEQLTEVSLCVMCVCVSASVYMYRCTMGKHLHCFLILCLLLVE